MKVKAHLKQIVLLAAMALAPIALWTGCSSGASPDPAATAQNEEIQRLRQENQQLDEVRAQNEEVQRLKKENQALPKVRNEYQQAVRLKKENEQLREQISKISPSGAAALATNAAHASAQATATTMVVAGQKEEAKPDEGTLNEGDEILVEPKVLKVLVPDIDWEKAPRKEPLGIRALLEKDGIQLTNVQQVRELGITNFTIQRAVPAPATPGQEPPAK